MLVWIASYPRSGNTFFRQLLGQIYGATSFEKYAWGPDHRPLKLEGFGTLRDVGLSLAEISESREQFFIKTHDLPDDNNPAVYIVRDGRDALISHAHFVLKYDLNIADPSLQQFHDTLRSLIETDSSFGGWGGNVEAWMARSAPTAIVKFEALISAPLKCVRQAMNEIGYRASENPAAALSTFDDLNRVYPEFFRRGEVGAWHDEMPQDLHELFWRRHGETMRVAGYRAPASSMAWWTVLNLLRPLRREHR
jgi:hypothetical protein